MARENFLLEEMVWKHLLPRTKAMQKSMTKIEEGMPGYISGYIEDVWKELEKIHNFSTEYFRPDDGTWGVLLPNGSWNGMIREMLLGRINVGISDFLLTSERIQAVDYLPPLINTGTYVFIKKTCLKDLNWDSYVSPFTTDLWGALAATAVLVAVCLLLDWALLHGRTRKRSLLETLYFVLACFLMQGYSPGTRLGSTCTIHFTAYIIASVMFAAYSAALVSFLATQRNVLPFATFQGLLDDGTYQLGVLDGSAQISYLERTENPVLRNVYERVIAPQLSNLPSNISSGLKRVCHDSKYSFMVEWANVWSVARNLSCLVIKVPGTEIPSAMSIILPKNSAHRELLSQTVIQMRSTGILQRLLCINIPAEEVDDLHEVNLRLNSVLTLLVFLGGGILMSSILLVVEILCRKLVELHQRKRVVRKSRVTK